MRDPKRIKPFLEKIGEIWEGKCPDWRFGQLMESFRTRYGDPFYFEDDDFLEKMEDFFEALEERPRYDFSLLSNVGFDHYDLEWLKGHEERILKYLYECYYTPTAMNNLKTMIEKGFPTRVTLAIWMRHGVAFIREESLFDNEVENMLSKFGKNNIQDYFWKYGEFPLFDCIGCSNERKREVTEEIQEKFREERRENMKKLVDVGFDEDDVAELEDVYNEFCLDIIEEYYMEPAHLKKLSELLDAGFHESLLLQLYIEEPERIFVEFSIQDVARRINQVEDVWRAYDLLYDRFLDTLFGQDENAWEEILEILRG